MKGEGSRQRGWLSRCPREVVWLAGAIALLLFQQIAIRTFPLTGLPGFSRRAIFLVTTILVLCIALRYLRYVGAWVVAVGIVLNLIPMVAHGGLMPVAYDVVQESRLLPGMTPADIGQPLPHGKDILLSADQISFPDLADRYIITMPGLGTGIYSLGDFVQFGGVVLVIVQIGVVGGVGAIRERRSAGKGGGVSAPGAAGE